MPGYGVGALLDAEPQIGASVDSGKAKGFGVGAMLDDEAEQERQRAQQAATLAVKTPPEQAGRVRQLAESSGLPVPVVERNTDTVAQQERLREIAGALAASPVLRRQMSDPEFAKIAQDDTPRLSNLEALVRFPWKVMQSVAAGVGPSLASGAYGLLAAPFELASQYIGQPLSGKLLPEDIFGKVGGALRAMGTNQAQYAERVADVPADAGVVGHAVASGFQSIGQNLPGLIAALYTGNAQAALLPMAATSGGQSYVKAREAGLSPFKSTLHGAEDAFWEYVTEIMPTTRLLGDMKAGAPFLKTFMRNQVGEQLGEQAATVLQDFDEWANLHPEKPFSEYLMERPTAALQTAIATAVGSGGQVVLMKAAQAVAGRTSEAAGAIHDAEALQRLLTESGLSPLRERSPASFANYINEAAADGPVPAVYVDAVTFAQAAQEAGIDVAKTMPETAAALQDAIDTRSDVRIPVGEFAAALPGTTLEQSLVPLLRTDPHGPTQQEAGDQKWVDATKALTEKILAEQQFNEQWRASREKVEADILRQLGEANRFTSQVNEAYSRFMGAFYATQAHRLGLTPEQMFARYPVRIQASGALGKYDTLGQADLTEEQVNAFAEDVKQRHGIDTLDLHVNKNGDIKLDTIAAAKTNTGAGTRAMQDVIDFADQHQRRIILSLAEKGYQPIENGPKTSSPERLRAFYKRFGFVDNKGRRKDFTLSEMMYRPPVAAGKGPAYHQAQRSGDDGQPDRNAGTAGAAEKLQRTVGGGHPAAGWSDATRIRGTDGKPRPLYRGAQTPLAAEHFAGDALGVASGNPSAGLGVWFTASETEAGGYGNVEAFYLDVRNPKIVKVEDLPGFDSVEAATVWREQLRAEGYDGIVVTAKHLGGRVHVVAFDPAQTIYTTAGTLDQPAYHGTPHNVDKFSTDYIGTGEGAQAYGWGLYFAENLAVATGYHRMLAEDPEIVEFKVGPYTLKRGDTWLDYNPKDNTPLENVKATILESLLVYEHDLRTAEKTGKLREYILNKIDYYVTDYFDPVHDSQLIAAAKTFKKMAERPNAIKFKLGPTTGGVYQVDIPDEQVAKMLDWDKPLREQSPAVKKAISDEPQGRALIAEKGNLYVDSGRNGYIVRASYDDSEIAFFEDAKQAEQFAQAPDMKGEALYHALVNEAGNQIADRKGPFWDLIKNDPNRLKMRPDEVASRYLASIGIPGLFYNDAFSRGGDKEEKTRNIVVFDDSIIKITHKDGTPLTAQERAEYMQPAQTGNRGSIQIVGDIKENAPLISLLPNADLSTFLHESGHFYLEVLNDMATQPDAPQQIKDDFNALLKWFGVGGTENVPAIDVWNSMTLNEKRVYHEQFARGFEAYLFEGKAPNTELNGLFARFRAWLVNVYKTVSSLNVTLTDEVRSVMDRLVATNQEILDAEEVRSYAPLFTEKPEGMSEQEWEAYQALAADATQEAVDQLQSRSLRDLKWAANAKSRVLKELQKEAEAKRRETRIDARREIMGEPIYQAWVFLTRRLGPDDKLPPLFERKARSDKVDEFNDSLFAAIAKLGGLNRDAVVSEWGTDKADKPASGLFGKPVWRAKGGLTVDGMAELLGQYGYLTLDEQGKVDLHEFEEKFTSELSGTPQYSMAYDYAANQDRRPGEQVYNPQALTAGRFDKAGLSDINATPEQVASLDDLGMTAKDGIHPDLVAEWFGFGSGDELVKKLLAAEPPAQAIEGLTDRLMLERYGDLADDRAIEKAANEAIHNEVRGRFVATELTALSKAVGERRTLLKAAKDFAAQILARKKIKDIRPTTYEAAEARAARNATAATKKGDLTTAAAEKRNQLVNFYAAKAANEAQKEVEKAVSYLKKLDGNDKIDPEYREQIEGILERFDLRAPGTRRADVRRRTLAEWVKNQQDAGFDPVVAADLIDTSMAQHYSTLTLEEFRGIVDTVRNIEHLGRLKKKLLTLQDQREFAAVVDEAAQAITDNAKRTVEAPLERNTWTAAMKSGVAEFFAMHRKFSSMIREMDGWKDDGVLWRIFVRPMNDAGTRETVMREKATTELSDLLKPILASGKMSRKVFIPEINASLSREGRIMVALNTGTDGNLQRLMDGDHWTQAQVQAVLDTLTKDEMDFVQAVWDYVGTFRTEIGAQQKRLTGVEPEWVEPRRVLTKHGEYRGGYIPVKYDTTRSTRSLSDEAAAGIMDQWRGARGAAKTRDSFTKARADKVVDRPLRKDFGVITQHVTEVTHRLAWQEFLIDANRLLRAGKIDDAIRTHYGPEVLKAMRDTITDIAAGETPAQNSFERGINYLRTGATIAGLGWRVTTSLLQPLGLTQSMVRIGPKYVARGLAEWLGDATRMENTAARIYEKSEMMRLRGKTMQREISEIQNAVRDRNSAIEASYFYLIQKMQLVADIPTWLGQYHKAIEQGADEAGAVAQADQAVIDAQGAGTLKDLSAIQRGGPLLKLFTNFYSFFNTTYQLTSEAVGRTSFKNPLSVGRLGVDLLLLYSVPAVLGTLLKAALHGDENDEDKLLRQLIADQLTYLFGTMVGLREVAGTFQTALGLPGDYTGPAAVRVFSEMAKLGKQAGQGEVDEALLKAANSVGGIVFHYPAGQINATADGIASLASGRSSNPGALLVGSNK